MPPKKSKQQKLQELRPKRITRSVTVTEAENKQFQKDLQQLKKRQIMNSLMELSEITLQEKVGNKIDQIIENQFQAEISVALRGMMIIRKLALQQQQEQRRRNGLQVPRSQQIDLYQSTIQKLPSMDLGLLFKTSTEFNLLNNRNFFRVPLGEQEDGYQLLELLMIRRMQQRGDPRLDQMRQMTETRIRDFNRMLEASSVPRPSRQQ